jgi:hypothetical protein
VLDDEVIAADMKRSAGEQITEVRRDPQVPVGGRRRGVPVHVVATDGSRAL